MKSIVLTDKARNDGLTPGTPMEVKDHVADAWIKRGTAIPAHAPVEEEAPKRPGRPKKTDSE